MSKSKCLVEIAPNVHSFFTDGAANMMYKSFIGSNILSFKYSRCVIHNRNLDKYILNGHIFDNFINKICFLSDKIPYPCITHVIILEIYFYVFCIWIRWFWTSVRNPIKFLYKSIETIFCEIKEITQQIDYSCCFNSIWMLKFNCKAVSGLKAFYFCLCITDGSTVRSNSFWMVLKCYHQ